MNQKPQYSTILHNLIALSLLSSTVSWLYMGVIQVFTPRNYYNNTGATNIHLNISLFIAAFNNSREKVLFCRQNVTCYTTKYIFWLGKNKFD